VIRFEGFGFVRVEAKGRKKGNEDEEERMSESWTSGLRARRGEEADGDTYAGRGLFPWNGSTGAMTRSAGEGREAVHGPGAGTWIQTSPAQRD
jgi:hypothetical protein